MKCYWEGRSYWRRFSVWIDSLIGLISTINTRPKCGKTLQKHQLHHAHLPFPAIPIHRPYTEEGCKLEEHQTECTEELCLNRKYHSILLLKKDLKRLADAAMDCFQVRDLYLAQSHHSYLFQKTNIEIEKHDYNRNHFVCFLCQSTEEFVNDGSFGIDLDIKFNYRY